jgi:hypothetical protein
MKKSYLSVWDQKNRKFIARGFKPGKVTIEFNRTKTLKIANHSLGQIDFNSNPQLNKYRNEVINRDLNKLTKTGFKYENIGHVFSPEGTFLDKNSNDEYEILAHGSPMRGSFNGAKENCSIEKLVCADGEGTNSICNPGKCKIGKIKRVTNFKWKYVSNTTFNSSENLEYFLGGKESIELKTIIRGNYKNISGTELKIDSPASKNTVLYLPPVNYLGDLFSKEYLSIEDGGIITSEEDFVRQIIKRAYKKKFGDKLELGGAYSSLSDSPLSEEVYLSFIDFFFKLPKVWLDKVKGSAKEKWDNRQTSFESNREFISSLFNEYKVNFTKVIQITESSFKDSRINFISDKNTRPTYLRLPSASNSYQVNEDDIIVISEENDRFNINISTLEIGTTVITSDRKIAYQFLPRVIEDKSLREDLEMSPVLDSRTKEELYSPKDTESWKRIPEEDIPRAPVAKWIMAGVDEFLREKKHDIDSFYYTYLDPTECSIKNLDWLAQHVGLSDPVWNVDWDNEHKRILIKNALGWFDENLSNSVLDTEYLTIKGEVLQEKPFNSGVWRGQEELESGQTDLVEINTFKIAPIGVNSSTGETENIGSYYKNNMQDLVSNFSINKGDWKGLMESKGSLLSLVFLFDLFNIKAHSCEELYKDSSGVFRVKSGLRSKEISAPVLLPYKQELLQVGTEEEYNSSTYVNQLVADRSIVTDLEGSKSIVFRLPFYYNSNGETWNTVERFAKHWLHGSLNPRVQYAYLAADLWKQGDVFFEPEEVTI